MKNYFIILCSLFMAGVGISQTKKLTLEDAVLQQNRLFKADKMTGFQWVPTTSKYAYFTENYTKMLIVNAKDSRTTLVITATEINQNIGTKLKNLFEIEWMDSKTILIADGNKYYSYSIETKTGSLLQETAETAENKTFDSQKRNLAFTEKNNLYFLNSKKERIAITTNTDMNIVSGQTISRSEFGISNGIFWSPKATYIAFYQKDETEVADYPLLDITQTPGKLTNIKYPMAGQKSEKPKVGIYNLATAKTSYISPNGKSDAYLTNVSWTPDEKYLLIAELNREQNNMNLNLYEAASGLFIKTLLSEKNEKWIEPEHPAFFPNEKSNNFIWISESNGFNNMYYYSIEGKLIKQLTNNNFPLREIIGSTQGKIVYFKATGENATNMLVYKVDLKGNQTLITKDFGVHQFSASPDGSYYFDEFSNHTTPSKSLIYNKNLTSKTIIESTNKYEGYEIGTSEIKTIKAADGTTDLYTRLIKPSTFDPNKKYPVCIYVYGGPHAQMITNSYLDGANLWMYWMAEQGYLVFTLDNRGSDNRGFAFESAIHRNVGTNEMADQMKGVDYLKSLPFVDSNRLAVHGWSYGGFMTNSLMLRKPDAFKVGVAGGPVVDWKWYEVMYGERYMDTPTENPKGFEEASLLTYVKDLKGKLLLIHGTNDDVVVEQHNLSLVKKFVEAGKQVDYFPYPMHKHNVQGKDRVHLMTKILNYIIDNNQ